MPRLAVVNALSFVLFTLYCRGTRNQSEICRSFRVARYAQKFKLPQEVLV